jgi:hypothetical protein
MTESAPAVAPPPADTTVPAASDILNPPPMPFEKAQSEKVRYLSDPALREAVQRGDSEHSKKWREINRALVQINAPEAEAREYAARQAALAPLKMDAPMDALFWDGVAMRAHVPLLERELALQTWAALKRDKAWVERCLAGGIEENILKKRIVGILAAPVGTPEQVEADRKAGLKRLGMSK